MKKFSLVVMAAVATLFVFSATLLVSCKDKCGNTTCQNGGTCSSNVCVCPTGYSGNSCQTAWTDKFIATYNCFRGSCVPASSGASTWTSTIVKNSTDGGESVVITNFAGSSTTVTATVDSVGKVKFAPAAGSYGISGNGELISTDSITLNYTLATASGAGSYSCSMVMVRQR